MLYVESVYMIQERDTERGIKGEESEKEDEVDDAYTLYI